MFIKIYPIAFMIAPPIMECKIIQNRNKVTKLLDMKSLLYSVSVEMIDTFLLLINKKLKKCKITVAKYNSLNIQLV